MAFIRSMHTEAINHEPAISLMQTGNMVTGRPCLGAWVSYGLGSLNDNLPTFVVMVARPTNRNRCRRFRLGCGPAAICRANTRRLRSARAAIRSCSSTIQPACPTNVRRITLDGLKRAEPTELSTPLGDPETRTRIAAI